MYLGLIKCVRSYTAGAPGMGSCCPSSTPVSECALRPGTREPCPRCCHAKLSPALQMFALAKSFIRGV